MNWEQLLSLKRQGDKGKRLRVEQDDTRLGFEVDYDRIIFSAAFRSLQDKTQVIPLSKTDFVHTRLTHSLEVSVVGRSLGRLVGKKILENKMYINSGLSAEDKYKIGLVCYSKDKSSAIGWFLLAIKDEYVPAYFKLYDTYLYVSKTCSNTCQILLHEKKTPQRTPLQKI